MNSSSLHYFKYSLNYFGNPWQSSLRGVFILVSFILLYLSLMFLALRPCQGRFPLKKYINTCPKLSMSSLLDYSIPKCVCIEAYLAVPVRPFPSRYLICSPFEFWNFFANPKSRMKIQCACFWYPIAKLSGLMSLCMIHLLWMYSTLLII